MTVLPKVIAVIRADDAAAAVEEADRLVAQGLEAVELTFTTPGAEEAIAEVVRRHPGTLVGAGTIVRPEQARTAAEAGAKFLVSPGSPPDLVRAMAATFAYTIAGCLTPTEIVEALDAGADAIKIFPAGPLGPAYVKNLLGPFPGVRFVPSGGIEPGDVDAWIEAGAAAVGIGSSRLA